jgi:ubiquinone/menaquinone biosynthesis C-methylase UbiE
MTTLAPARRADHYDDPAFNYQDYWRGRDYEHAAEEAAIDRLLAGRRFARALDVGGGYGRLSRHLVNYADEVILAEPSEQQLGLARRYLRNAPAVRCLPAQAADLRLPDESVDVAVLVRVLHHIPDPAPELAEIARVLRPGGTLLLEFANLSHALNRVRYAVRGRRIPRMPVEIAASAGRALGAVPFVNHHPKALLSMVERAGFAVEAALSGSNLRSAAAKRLLSTSALLWIERRLQPALAPLYFGPSIWLRLRKTGP